MSIAARLTPLGAPFVLALLLAVLYLLLPLLAVPQIVIVVVKGAVCPLLALSIWRWRGGDAVAKLLSLALLFSAAGDVFLALDRVRLFVPALGSFLLAHLAYLVLFLRYRGRPALRLQLRQWVLITLLLIYAAIMLAVLTPGLGKLLLPVYGYVAAIIAMGIAALALPGKPLVGLGAVSFILSDSLIALDKFVEPIAWAGPAIWITYVAAQVLILLGWRKQAASG
ncbi:lysoplasmalogenase [Ferrovibrio sp.]|uniref:lysoplasmalogenase n=1 Tax=Ferrovibrio sp. TaxID=1917215 RepID=UPI003D11FCA1